MNKLFNSIIFILIGININYAQVGIGTESPQAMLDVAGTVLVQGETTLQQPLKLQYIQSEAVTQLTGNETILVADLGDQNIVKEVNLQNLSNGLGPFDLNRPNPSVYSAKVASSITLLNVGILINNWQPISFPSTSRIVGNTALVDSNGVYTVPSNGVYAIGVYFRYGTGIQASVLSGTPSVGIVRRPNGNTTSANDAILEYRNFSGINLAALVNITISEVEMNTLYPLNQGDKIYFALNRGGVATLGLLGSSSSSFYIYKVAGLPQ